MKKIKKIKYKYRNFTIIEYFDEDSMSSSFHVCYGLLKTPAIPTYFECQLLIDECYKRADAKKKRKDAK